MKAINITAFTNNDGELNAIKAFMKALKVKFEITDKPYNDTFVAKIKSSEADFKDGNYTTVKAEEIKNYVDSL